MYSARYSCQIFNKNQFSGQSFEKYSNIKFMKIREPSFSMRYDGRTDRHDETKSRFRKPKNKPLSRALEKLVVAQPVKEVNLLRDQTIRHRDQKVRHWTLPLTSSVQSTLYYITSLRVTVILLSHLRRYLTGFITHSGPSTKN